MRRLPTALLLCLAPVPALACSDLPNICAQQWEVHQQNMDMAYEAAEAYGRQQEEYLYGDDGHTDAGPPPFDPMQARLDAAHGLFSLVAQSAGDVDRLGTDPRHDRYVNGGWDFFQDHADARPGEYCAALYWKGDTLVRLSGPGRGYDGAMFTFWSPDIPMPATVETVPVTLVQSDGTQAVRAFHYRQANEPFAAIALAVPTIAAALDTMEDVQSFELRMEGRAVATIEWTGGLAARDRLRACVAGQR